MLLFVYTFMVCVLFFIIAVVVVASLLLRSFHRLAILVGPENVTTFRTCTLTCTLNEGCSKHDNDKEGRAESEKKIKSQHNIKSIDFCSPLHLLSLSHSGMEPAAVRLFVIFSTCVIWSAFGLLIFLHAILSDVCVFVWVFLCDKMRV